MHHRQRELQPIVGVLVSLATVALAACDTLVPLQEDEVVGAPAQRIGVPEAWSPPPASVADYFDANPSPVDTFSVVGSVTPSISSWGAIELLEGDQAFRTEGYNRRTQKLRYTDTFQSSDYPLADYFGDLNQGIVDTFDLAYSDPCTAGTAPCAIPGPTRPEARYVALHHGPDTASGTCDDTTHAPVLLVHGALQDANVWLFPNGNDGTGNTYDGASPSTGLVQALEADGRCVYAVTFGNFHGDNYNQATHVGNAILRIQELHGDEPVDVIAWSKGVLAVDAYLSNAADWQGFGSRLFDQIAQAQADRVPHYRGDIRSYVALSGPHKGIDLNFRHPIHTLTIASTAWNAPVGRGPMPWTHFSAMQCVTFGYSAWWFDNPYAQSICKDRGGVWPDYFQRIYVSNLVGLDATGAPVAADSLESLNVDNGLSASDFSFDEYNMSLFGSIDADGDWSSAYLGQLQAAYDLRGDYPIPTDRDSYGWDSIDPDEERWFPWIIGKLVYNPYNWWVAAGYLDDDDHDLCRNAAFELNSDDCSGYHAYNTNQNAEGYDGFNYARYRLFNGLGIDVAEEMGGHFIDRLSSHGLDPSLPRLFVLYGDDLGAVPFETDGLSCPTCTSTPHSDGVLFESSIAAVDQLTQGWTPQQKADQALQEAIGLSHLEIGVDPAAATRILDYLDDVDADL